MGRPYSMDLRERVVAAVEKGGLSCHRAAAQFGLGISTVINWVRRVRETGSVAPGQMGGHKPKAISGEHRELAAGADPGARDFTLRGLVAELAERGPEGRLSLGLELRPRREAELQKKPWSPANAIVLTSRAGERNGQSIRAALILSAWSSSTRPGPRPTWRRCGDGRRAAPGSRPRFRTATGRPTTFLAALRHDRIDAPWVLDGPIDGESFRTYVEKVLLPTLKPGDIVIMDNLGSHKGKAVRALIRSAGAKLFFLPKYSPDLNPIEQVFAKLKHLLRKAAARTVEAVCAAIGQLLEAFTPQECANYFKNAGYA